MTALLARRRRARANALLAELLVLAAEGREHGSQWHRAIGRLCRERQRSAEPDLELAVQVMQSSACSDFCPAW